jgi:chromosome segregation ATPase
MPVSLAAARFRSSVVTVSMLLMAASVGGCGKLSEIEACRGVARTLNAAFDEIERLQRKPGPASQQQLAARYGKLAKELKAYRPAQQKLDAQLEELSQIMVATETALRTHAEASAAGETPRATEARRELERLVRRQKTAASRFDSECGS